MTPESVLNWLVTLLDNAVEETISQNDALLTRGDISCKWDEINGYCKGRLDAVKSLRDAVADAVAKLDKEYPSEDAS